MYYSIFIWGTTALSLAFIFLFILSIKRKNEADQKKASILMAAVSLLAGFIYLLGILNSQFIILGFIKNTWPWLHLSLSTILAFISLIKFRKNFLGYAALFINISLLIFINVISNDIQKIINEPGQQKESTESLSFKSFSNKNQISYFI
ncbi:MAG: hypothetical protein IAF38_19885 [Bacteroidia bacterium]|nr:hypothetical protein [Bacteroidia bacterium]